MSPQQHHHHQKNHCHHHNHCCHQPTTIIIIVITILMIMMMMMMMLMSKTFIDQRSTGREGESPLANFNVRTTSGQHRHRHRNWQCPSISRTYPGESVRQWHFQIPLRWYLWTVTEPLCLFSENRDQQPTAFNFQSVCLRSVCLRSVPSLRIFWAYFWWWLLLKYVPILAMLAISKDVCEMFGQRETQVQHNYCQFLPCWRVKQKQMVQAEQMCTIIVFSSIKFIQNNRNITFLF